MYNVTIKDRLRKFVETLKVADYAFENQCGLAGGTLSNNSEPSGPVLAKILETYPTLSADWLITGVGSMMKKLEPIGLKLTKEGLDVVSAPANVAPVNEPTQPYKSIKREKDEMVTIPSSILDALRQQLENKDAQIATLLQVINSKK